MSRPSVRMSPRPIEEATIRSDVIGDAHDPQGEVRGSAMTGLSNLACAKRIRGSAVADVKRGTYQRRLIVCHPAPIRMEAEVKVKIVLMLTAAVLLSMPWPAHAQGPPGPYPGPPPGPGYPSPGYPGPGYPGPGYPGPGYPGPGYPSPGYGDAQWAHCQQLEQVMRDIAGRLQFTPPSPERAAMEQQLSDLG